MRELLVLLVLTGCGGGEIYLVSDLKPPPDMKWAHDFIDFFADMSPVVDLAPPDLWTPDLWMCLLPNADCAVNSECCGNNVNAPSKGLHCGYPSSGVQLQRICCMELGGPCAVGIPCCQANIGRSYCDLVAKKCVTL